MYLALKHLHITCVVLSGLGFLLRGFWMLQESPRLQGRLPRVAPHVVDTLLLGSALALAFLSGQYPFVQGWLTAKVLALLAYIGCGSVASSGGAARRCGASFSSWPCRVSPISFPLP